jgi:hypothetical protein
MRLHEIQQPAKPKTPDQQRVSNLQSQVKRSQQAVKSERARQKLQKAQQGLSMLRATNTPTK